MPARRTRLVLTVLASVTLLASGAASVVQRIPSGHVGIGQHAVWQPGWRIHPPFSPEPTIASSGALTLKDIALATAEGSTLEFQLELRYAVSRTLAPQLALDIRRDGFDKALEGLARRVLADAAQHTDVESLLSEPARVETPLRVALR